MRANFYGHHLGRLHVLLGSIAVFHLQAAILSLETTVGRDSLHNDRSACSERKNQS